MLIGIDVGGTYTDGVLFSEGRVIHSIKHRTDEADLTGTLLLVLDDLLAHGDPEEVQRVVLSTTLVTNLLATGQGERTALLLLPGSGLPESAYKLGPDTNFLKGSIDFRGREIEPPDEGQIAKVLQELDRAGIRRVAIAGKFSIRNNSHEKLVKEMAGADYPRMEAYIGSEVTGGLNFPRRAVTCYYTAMVMKEWNRFADGIEAAITARIPGCELHVLKADGGTTTIDASRERPCETVFSGPAASTMGGAALCREPLNSVVVDIGGTTSDIGLLIEGQPLYASKGALIGGHLTQIRSFAVNSVAIGGDSPLVVETSRGVEVGKMRLGNAVCFGGRTPTVTDAFNVLLDLNMGDPKASHDSLGAIAARMGQTLQEICKSVVDRVIEALKQGIREMFRRWEDEPAYKVWEVVNRRKFVLHQVIGLGAAAPAIVPMLARELGVTHFLHRHSSVANALGAAIARPTLAVQVHVDTERGFYTVSPGGLRGSVKEGNYQIADARYLAQHTLEEIAGKSDLAAYANESEVYLEEQFNVIRNGYASGKLFDVAVQIRPGFIHGFEGVTE